MSKVGDQVWLKSVKDSLKEVGPLVVGVIRVHPHLLACEHNVHLQVLSDQPLFLGVQGMLYERHPHLLQVAVLISFNRLVGELYHDQKEVLDERTKGHITSFHECLTERVL